MIVLGIDPGIAITGLALIEQNNQKQKLLDTLCVRTKKNLPTPERLSSLYKTINKFLKRSTPDAAAVENLFFNTNTTTAFVVGQARGVVQLALSQKRIPIFEYTPIEVKMAITGYGRATKSQVQKMVSQILKLSKNLTPDDLADAAAIGLTYCFTYKLKQKTHG